MMMFLSIFFLLKRRRKKALETSKGEKKQGDEKQAKFLSTQCIGQFEAYSSTQCALYNLKSAKSAIFGVKKKFGLWLKLSKFVLLYL